MTDAAEQRFLREQQRAAEAAAKEAESARMKELRQQAEEAGRRAAEENRGTGRRQ